MAAAVTVYSTPSACELNRPLASKLKYVWNVGDITFSSAFVAIFHRIMGKMSDVCVCPNHAIYLVFVSNAESINLTFGNNAQNVRIGHSESEMKEIHCSNSDAM